MSEVMSELFFPTSLRVCNLWGIGPLPCQCKLISLALRENILRVNGIDILPWWVYHHYCAMAMALIILTCGMQGQSACHRKQQGVRLFLSWAVMQGVAMLLRNSYQRQRLYTWIAVGKAGRMDFVWGETAGVKGQL